MKEEEEAASSYAALGVGFVCIVIGLPLWWKTTEVYRVQLPYSEIELLQGQKVSYRVTFNLIAFEEGLNEDYLTALGQHLKVSFEELGNDGEVGVRYRGNVRRAQNEEKEQLKTLASIQEFDDWFSHSDNRLDPGRYSIHVLPANTKLAGLAGKPVMGRHNSAFIVSQGREEIVSMVHHLLRELFVDEKSMAQVVQSASGVRQVAADKASMRALHYQPGYDVTFTLFNPQPDILDVRWDIRTAIQQYLQPCLKSFQEMSEINVKSQYLHYASMAVRPTRHSSGSYSTVSQDQLPHIINPIEAHLSSHVSVNPNLNFILYIPSRDQAPLYILNSHEELSADNAFLSPRWGGMLIYNTESPENETLPAHRSVDMKPVMETFLSQLRLLLGVRPPPQVSSHGVETLQPGIQGVASWELDKWQRERSLENVATATATLHSLIQLLSQVGNIVINDNIGQEVNRAVSSITDAHRHLVAGRLRESFQHARQARISSEKAFFDPSLLELLYFPEDQKFAIYIPLFLPISIPILISLARSAKWIKSKYKKQEKTDKSE